MHAQDFVEQLQEGERWIEVIQGQLIQLEPPSDEHGNIVRNLMKPLARWAAAQSELVTAFDLAIHLRDDPLTIIAPAISLFRGQNRFAFADELLTRQVPVVVIEIGSTPDRRAELDRRINLHLQAGVKEVWAIDSLLKTVRQVPQEGILRVRETGDELRGEPWLPGFLFPVGEIFADPQWWNPE